MSRSAILAMLALFLLAGCAPMIQQAGRPEIGFAGPRLEDHDFVAADGAHIAMTRWLPLAPDGAPREPWAVIVGLHGMNDYSNAFHLAAPYWAADGIATYAYDQRGFGRSPGRGVWGGDALMTEDLRTLTALVRQRYPHAVIAVAGVSLGGAVAIEAFASDRPPVADRVVLLAPAVWGWSSQPIPYKTALWLTAHVAPSSVIEPPRFVTLNIRATDNDDELRLMGRVPRCCGAPGPTPSTAWWTPCSTPGPRSAISRRPCFTSPAPTTRSSPRRRCARPPIASSPRIGRAFTRRAGTCCSSTARPRPCGAMSRASSAIRSYRCLRAFHPFPALRRGPMRPPAPPL